MLLVGILLVFVGLLCPIRALADTDPLQGLYDLVARQLPKNKDSFSFVLEVPDETVLDSFSVQDLAKSRIGAGPFIEIKCTSQSSCARGLYTYVNCHPRSHFAEVHS